MRSFRSLAFAAAAVIVLSLVPVPAQGSHDDPHATIKYWDVGGDPTIGGYDPHETIEDIEGVTGHVSTPEAPLTLVTSMENTGYGFCGPMYWNPVTNVFKTYRVTGGLQTAGDVNRDAPPLTDGAKTFEPGDAWFTVNGNTGYSVYVNFRDSDNFRRYPMGSNQMGIRMNQNTGKVYTGAFGEGRIYELDPATNAVRSWTIGNRPYWVDVDESGDVYTAAAAAGGHPDQIVRVTPSTGAVRRWDLPGGGLQTFVGFGMANAVRIDPQGNLWVSQTTAGTVARLDPATGRIDRYTNGDVNDPHGVAASGGGTSLQSYFTEANGNSIGVLTAVESTPASTIVTPADSTVAPGAMTASPVDFTIAPLETTIEPQVFDAPGTLDNGIIRFPIPAGEHKPAGMSRVAESRTIYGTFESSNTVFRLESDAIIAPPASKASAESYTARVRVDTVPLDTGKISRAAVSGTDQDDATSILSESVGTELSVGVGRSESRTTKTEEKTTSTGSHTIADVSLLGGLITAEKITAKARAEFDPATEEFSESSEGSGFVNLNVAGTPVSDGIPANTSIPIPGVGTVTLREEIAEVTEAGASLEVNMIHFESDDGSIEIVVSSASAGVGSHDPSGDPPQHLPPLPELPGVPGASGVPPVECLTGEPYLQEGFEDGLGSFTTDNPNLWDTGPPTWHKGPGAATEGTSVAGTLVDGSFPAHQIGALVSPEVDLTSYDPEFGACMGKSAVLSFDSWFETPNYHYDCGYIQVSTDAGETWELVHPDPGYNYLFASYCGGIFPYPAPSFSGLGLSEWARYEVDLTPFAGETVSFRFRFGGYEPFFNDDGWSIDDVRVNFE